MPVREKFVRSGDWRTLETFWNVTTTAWFQKPAGAEVKIRYSGWWFGADRQRQRLDGSTVKRLVISRWSVFTARLQVEMVGIVARGYTPPREHRDVVGPCEWPRTEECSGERG